MAVVVLALGLAGIAALLLANVSGAASAQVRSAATVQAEALADLMRANVAGLETGEFAANPGVPAVTCTVGDDCTPAEQAAYDFALWQNQLATALPGGQAIICNDISPYDGQPAAPACDGGNLKVIKIFWRDDRHPEGLAAGEQFHRFATPVFPKAVEVPL